MTESTTFGKSNHVSMDGSDYHILGKESAARSNASLSTIEASLNVAYSRFQNNEKKSNAERIQKYNNVIDGFFHEKNNIIAGLREIEVKKGFLEEQIQDKKDELTQVRAGGATADSLPLGIGAFILILLTLYLFVFYSSTGYTAFFGLPSKLIGGFLSTSVYNDAINAGGGAIAFVVLFPMVFLAVGFGVHISIEKKRYLLLTVLLLFTLLFDFLLAFRIAKSVHQEAYQTNQTSTQWEANLAYSDINFWITIAAGFVVYIIWGYLLNFVINEWNRIQPDKIKQAAIDKLQEHILNMSSQLAAFENQVNLISSNLSRIEDEINDKKDKIKILQSGGIIIDIAELEGMVGKFVEGWQEYIQSLSEDSSKLVNRWLEDKKNTLKD